MRGNSWGAMVEETGQTRLTTRTSLVLVNHSRNTAEKTAISFPVPRQEVEQGKKMEGQTMQLVSGCDSDKIFDVDRGLLLCSSVFSLLHRIFQSSFEVDAVAFLHSALDVIMNVRRFVAHHDVVPMGVLLYLSVIFIESFGDEGEESDRSIAFANRSRHSNYSTHESYVVMKTIVHPDSCRVASKSLCLFFVS